MLDEANEKRCWELLSKYGVHSQFMMMVEECSELQKAICKMFREQPSNVEEELVDVIVMAEQLRLIVKLDMGEVNRLAAAKMDRALEAK